MKRHVCPVCHGRSISRAHGVVTDCPTCFGTGHISGRDRLAFYGGLLVEASIGLVVIWALIVITSGTT